MATALWVPPDRTARRADPKVSREHEAGTRAWEEAVIAQCHWTGGVLDHWRTELEKIDRNLWLAQAMPQADCAGLIPGFYHLIRRRDPAENTMMMVQPLRGPNDEFVEPSSAMLDALRMCDLQNDQVVRAQRSAALNASSVFEAQRLRDENDRTREGMERFLAATRAQVSMIPGWSQNVAGRRGGSRS